MSWKIVAGGLALLAALAAATLHSRWQAEAFFALLIVAARVVQALIRGDAPAAEAMSRRIFACGVVLLVALAAAADLDARRQAEAFVALLGVASLAYVGALRLVGRLAGYRSAAQADRRALAGCLLLAVVWRLVLLGAAPLVSDDAYRYVWDGRVQQHGLNPLETAPADPALARLHTELTRRIDPTSAVLPSIYPPLAQRFFLGVTSVHESVLAMAAAVLVCDLLIIGTIWRWLAVTRRSPWWVLAYAWHPLVALEGAGGAHIDIAGALLLVGAAYALSRRRSLLAAVGFAGAFAVKFVPVVLLPLLWKRVRPVDAAVGALLVVLRYLPFLDSSQLPVGSLGTYLAQWRFNGPLFRWLSPWTGTAPVVAFAVAAGLAVAVHARRTRDRGRSGRVELASGGHDLPAARDLSVVPRLADPVPGAVPDLACRRLDPGVDADLHGLDAAPGGRRLGLAGVGGAGGVRAWSRRPQGGRGGPAGRRRGRARAVRLTTDWLRGDHEQRVTDPAHTRHKAEADRC